MYVLMICLIAVVLIIGIFCVVVVTRDIVTEERAKKKCERSRHGNARSRIPARACAATDGRTRG